MTAHQLAALLLAGPDNEVFMSPNVAPVDAVEQCPGDPTFALAPYVVIQTEPVVTEIPMYCYKHSSYYCGCAAQAAS